MKRVICLCVCLIASPCWAQLPTPATPTEVAVLVLPAAGDPAVVPPVATRVTPIGPALNCNQAALPDAVPPLVNPTLTQFNDPFTAGAFCRAPLPTGLPDGDYLAVAVLIAPTCVVNGTPTSPCPSARSLVGVPPFAISGPLSPPLAPTGLKVSP